MGRAPGHRGRDRHRHKAGGDAVPGLRGPAGQRRPELGLELGRQQPTSQRGGQRKLPAVQQRTQISGEHSVSRAFTD